MGQLWMTASPTSRLGLGIWSSRRPGGRPDRRAMRDNVEYGGGKGLFQLMGRPSSSLQRRGSRHNGDRYTTGSLSNTFIEEKSGCHDN